MKFIPARLELIKERNPVTTGKWHRRKRLANAITTKSSQKILAKRFPSSRRHLAREWSNLALLTLSTTHPVRHVCQCVLETLQLKNMMYLLCIVSESAVQKQCCHKRWRTILWSLLWTTASTVDLLFGGVLSCVLFRVESLQTRRSACKFNMHRFILQD